MTKFDPKKPVQTRDGRKAEIVSLENDSEDYPILALVTNKSGKKICISCTLAGDYYNESGSEDGLDLVNLPEKRTRWINIYSDDFVVLHPDRDTADTFAMSSCGEERFACIRVEFEEGQGL